MVNIVIFKISIDFHKYCIEKTVTIIFICNSVYPTPHNNSSYVCQIICSKLHLITSMNSILSSTSSHKVHICLMEIRSGKQLKCKFYLGVLMAVYHRKQCDESS